jgi:signal peptide peptidase SppA
MKLAHLITNFYGRPWAIHPQAWQAIHQLIKSKLATDPGLIAAEIRALAPVLHDDNPDLDGVDGPDAPIAVDGGGAPMLTFERGRATIAIHGIIGRRLDWITKACMGGVDVLDISHALDVATSRLEVAEIHLDIDSPGGALAGVPELAEKIARINRDVVPVKAFIGGMGASAAYWLAAGTEEIAAMASADVGSIGVYNAFLDQSAQFAKEGVAWDIIKAGKFKAEGLPGTKLSPEFRDTLQAEVDLIYTWFADFVLEHRPNVKSETMQGQTFMGEEALAAGLIDGLAIE